MLKSSLFLEISNITKWWYHMDYINDCILCSCTVQSWQWVRKWASQCDSNSHKFSGIYQKVPRIATVQNCCHVTPQTNQLILQCVPSSIIWVVLCAYCVSRHIKLNGRVLWLDHNTSDNFFLNSTLIWNFWWNWEKRPSKL